MRCDATGIEKESQQHVVDSFCVRRRRLWINYPFRPRSRPSVVWHPVGAPVSKLKYAVVRVGIVTSPSFAAIDAGSSGQSGGEPNLGRGARTRQFGSPRGPYCPMNCQSWRVGSSRCLGVVLSPRIGGIALLGASGHQIPALIVVRDRRGEPCGWVRSLSFRCARDLPRIERCLERTLRRVLRRASPTCAVLAASTREDPIVPRMRAIAVRFFLAHGIPVRVRALSANRALLVGRSVATAGAVADTLDQIFTTPIRAPTSRRWDARRYSEPAWNALGLALWGLAEQAPLAANALLQHPGTDSPLRRQISILAHQHTQLYAPQSAPSRR